VSPPPARAQGPLRPGVCHAPLPKMGPAAPNTMRRRERWASPCRTLSASAGDLAAARRAPRGRPGPCKPPEPRETPGPPAIVSSPPPWAYSSWRGSHHQIEATIGEG
jgi:hypothetical protein